MRNLKSIIDLKKNKAFFVLIKPEVKFYKKVIHYKLRNFYKKKIFKKEEINTKRKFISHLSKGSNELQLIVEKKYPIVKGLLTNIKNEKGCHFSRMTGSGSVCYGLFNNQIKAKMALKNLKVKYPKFWSTLAKTV